MRDFDVVLFGATGYTGQVVAEYLQQHAPAGLRWAIAGRSQSKLEQVRDAVAAPSVPTLLASSDDEASLRAMAKRATVVITTVGPYAVLGLPLVRACAAEGTHYVDLTGEVQFTRSSIDECNDAAKRSGACIVHSCGFDSIPSDLGCLLLHDHFQRGGQGGLSRATLYVDKMKGGFSGGTAQSLLSLFDDAAESESVQELLSDPYALTPDRERGPDTDDDASALYDEKIGRWTALFPMAPVNTRVVRRSNALLGHPYGKDFRYTERSVFAAGTKGMLLARVVAAGYRGMMRCGESAPSRALLRAFLPAGGAGPTRAQRDAGYFRIRVRGEARDGSVATAQIVGHADPGYAETAKMLAESAFLLSTGTHPGGVSTPAAALGLPLVERLRVAGMEWNVLSQENA